MASAQHTPPAYEYDNSMRHREHLTQRWSVIRLYKQAIVLGSVEAVFGMIALVIGGLSFITDAAAHDVAFGLWGGICMIASGTVGIAAGKERREKLVIMNMILSVITTAITVAVGVLSAVALYFDNECGFGHLKCGTSGAVMCDGILLTMGILGCICCILGTVVAIQIYRAGRFHLNGSTGHAFGWTDTDQIVDSQIDDPDRVGQGYLCGVRRGGVDQNPVPIMEIDQPVIIHTTSGPMMIRPAALPQGALSDVRSSQVATLQQGALSDVWASQFHSDLPPAYEEVINERGTTYR